MIARPVPRPEAGASVVDHRRLKEMRSQLSENVSAWSARSGTPHGMIHHRLREMSGGPAVAQATAEQPETRLQILASWVIGWK